jgi:1-acyl-sn-glycerol-3-phosphate acyltransferase
MLKPLAKWILRLAGWTLVGRVPDLDKAVFIAAPHTSNWDGFWFLVYKYAIDVEVSFLAKDALFWWPLGPLLRSMGALPIDRHDAATVVSQLVDAFEQRDHLFLALAPEGTRKWRPYWKSGFYRIAQAAKVPVVLAFIDYRGKQIGIGPTLPADRTLQQDLAAIREFYLDFRGKRPELQGPVEFAPDD